MAQANNTLYQTIKDDYIKSLNPDDKISLEIINLPEFEKKVQKGINTISYYGLLAELINNAKINEFNKDEYLMAMLGLDGELFLEIYGANKIPALARAHSSYDFEELKIRVEKSLKVVVEIFNTIQAMTNSNDEELKNKASINKATFVLNERTKENKVEDVYGNTQNQKKIWSAYKPYLHLILALDFMEEKFQNHHDEYNFDFDEFMLNNWQMFEKAINDKTDVVLDLKLGKNQLGIITKDEMFKFAVSTNKKIDTALKKDLSAEYLKKIINKYRAPKTVY